MTAEKKEITLTGNQVMRAFQNERAKLDALNDRKMMLQGRMSEILMARDSLNAIKRGEKGEKILINLGAGIYAHGLVDDKVNVKRSLTAPVVVDSTIEEALKEIEKRRTELIKMVEELQGQQQATIKNIEGFGRVIQAAGQARKQLSEKKGK